MEDWGKKIEIKKKIMKNKNQANVLRVSIRFQLKR